MIMIRRGRILRKYNYIINKDLITTWKLVDGEKEEEIKLKQRRRWTL